MKRLLVLTDGIYPFVVGGMQRHSSYLVKHLSARGWHITLVHAVAASSKLPSAEEVCSALGVEMSRVEVRGFHFPAPGFYPGHYLKESYAYSKMVYESLKNRVNEFDFIYAKGFAAWHLLQLKKNRGLSTPPVGVKFHGYEMFQPPASFVSRFHHLLLRGPVRWNTLNADVVFSYGGKITGILQRMGVPRSKIAEVPTGIDPDWFVETVNAVHRPVRFLFLGRYERRKGVEELGKVLAVWKGPQIRFDFVGPIPSSKKLKLPWVNYHGQVTDTATLRAIMDECDALVVPSHSEGMPNVIMEGMARGMVVVATDVGGVAVQLGEGAIGLIPQSNQVALEQTMARLAVLDDAEWMLQKQSSLMRVRQLFSWENIARRIEQEIQGRM
jgi:glycosyltransferase involved in cell wall biosynthesis